MNERLLPLFILLLIITLFLGLILINVGTVAFAQEDIVPEVKDDTLSIELVSSSLKEPTSMAFLGPNDILVTEKNTGTVQRIQDGEMFAEPLLDVNVNGEDERGLLGIAISKNANVGKTYVFLYYTEAERGTQESEGGDDDSNEEAPSSNGDNGQPIGNRLYRYELAENGSKLVNPTLLLDLPYLPRPAHNG